MAAPIVRTYEPDETAKPVYDILYQEYGRLHDYFGRGANPVMKTLKTLSVEQKKGYCSHHAKSRHGVNNNPLRVCTETAKTQFRAV